MKQSKIIRLFPTQQFKELRFDAPTYKAVMSMWGQEHVHKAKDSNTLTSNTRLLCENLGYAKDEPVIGESECCGLRARNQSKDYL
jgi:hypothetical protein